MPDAEAARKVTGYERGDHPIRLRHRPAGDRRRTDRGPDHLPRGRSGRRRGDGRRGRRDRPPRGADRRCDRPCLRRAVHAQVASRNALSQMRSSSEPNPLRRRSASLGGSAPVSRLGRPALEALSARESPERENRRAETVGPDTYRGSQVGQCRSSGCRQRSPGAGEVSREAGCRGEEGSSPRETVGCQAAQRRIDPQRQHAGQLQQAGGEEA